MSDSSSIFNINGFNYNLEEGNAYFVNIGAYHYASNDSNIPRYHFLIDSILDENLLSMFQNAEIPIPVSYTEKEEIRPEHDKRSSVDLDLQTYDHIRILK
jgi:hypothetical protein